MAINSYFFNAVEQADGTYDRTYNAQNFTDYLKLLVGNGVFPNPSTNLQVSANSGMNIAVAAGSGWINGYKMDNSTTLTLTVDAADTLLGRIDNVVFYLDYENRAMGIEIVAGTAASTPVAPTLQQDTSRYELCLAQIAVAKQTTTITAAMITDTRADSDLCGWVAGLIQQVDTSTLWAQWQDAYQNYYDQMTASFQSWFDDLAGTLNVNTYIEEFTKYVNLTSSSSAIIPLNMTGYTYESTDIFFISINGLLGIENTDWYLDTSESPVELHVNVANKKDEDIDIKILKSKIGFDTLTTSSGDTVATSNAEEIILT